MLNEYYAKRYCSEDISLIENYHEAISDQNMMWEIHHRRESDENGRTLFTHKQLKEMGLYFNRPASELIFLTRSLHYKLHREIHEKGCRIGGGSEAAKEAAKEKNSIPILQFTKAGELVKEWQSAYEAQRHIGIAQQSICACLKGRYKSAGGFIWRYK